MLHHERASGQHVPSSHSASFVRTPLLAKNASGNTASGNTNACVVKQHLHEQRGQRPQMPLPKGRNRVVVGVLIARQHPQRHVLVRPPLDAPRGGNPTQQAYTSSLTSIAGW